MTAGRLVDARKGVSGDQTCGREDAIRQREDTAGTEERKRGYEGLRLGSLTPRTVKTLLQVYWTMTGTRYWTGTQYEIKTRIRDAKARTAVTKVRGTDSESEGRPERRGGKSSLICTSVYYMGYIPTGARTSEESEQKGNRTEYRMGGAAGIGSRSRQGKLYETQVRRLRIRGTRREGPSYTEQESERAGVATVRAGIGSGKAGDREERGAH